MPLCMVPFFAGFLLSGVRRAAAHKSAELTIFFLSIKMSLVMRRTVSEEI